LTIFFVTRTGALKDIFAESLVSKFSDTLVQFQASPDDVVDPVT
jgi:hypothetical protein